MLIIVFAFGQTVVSAEEVKTHPLMALKYVRSAVLYDAETMTQIYSFAGPVRTYPAITAKMMVALIVIEQVAGNYEEKVTVPNNIAMIQSGAHIELEPGEIISVYDLLVGLVLHNANDAAYALAMHISGNIESFVELMNEKAISLGMRSTNYVNVTDADETGAYTTAEDVAKLARALTLIEEYREIAAKTVYTMPATNKSPQRKLYTRNYLLSRQIYPDYYMSEATGLASGGTVMGGYCTVATAKIADRDYICVVMNAKAGSDIGGFYNLIAAKDILLWGSDKYTYKTLIDSGKIMGEIKVRLAEEYDWVGVIPKGEIVMFMPKDVSVEAVTQYQTDIFYDVLTAPVLDGEEVGVVKVYYEGEYVGSLPLVTRRGLGQSKTESFMTVLGNFITSRAVTLSVGGIALAMLIGILIKSIWLYRKSYKIQVEYEE